MALYEHEYLVTFKDGEEITAPNGECLDNRINGRENDILNIRVIPVKMSDWYTVGTYTSGNTNSTPTQTAPKRIRADSPILDDVNLF